MNNHLHWIWMAALVSSGFCGPLAAEPVTRHLTVKVTLDNASDFKNIGGSNAKTKTQTRQLNVTLDNRDKEPANDVSVKWAIYAHKMTDHKLVTVKQGTVKAKVGALETTTVKSDKVTITGTPRHSVTTNRKVNGKNQSSSKTNPATGEEYYGYSVAVYAGSVLIDEVYSQPSLKPGK